MEFMDCLHSAHVLLLDARNIERIRYADTLRSAGLLVTALADAETAYRVAVERQPRVIIACVNGANRNDRLAFCRRLKADPRTQTIPTLLASTTLSAEDIRLATASGALAIAVSPNDGTKLVSAIRGVLAVDERKPLASFLDRKDRRSA
jgi:CheY-like chemotaxis protein